MKAQKTFILTIVLIICAFKYAKAYDPIYPIVSKETAIKHKKLISQSGAKYAKTVNLLELAQFYIYSLDSKNPQYQLANSYLAILAGRLKKNQVFEKFRIEILKSVTVFKLKDTLRAGFLLKEIIHRSENESQFEMTAWAYYEWGLTEYPNQRMERFEKAYEFAKKSGSKNSFLAVSYSLAYYYHNRTNYQKSQELLLDCIKKYKPYPGYLYGGIYSLLSVNAERMDNNALALQYGLLSLSNYRGANDTTKIGDAYWAVGRVLKYLLRIDEGISYLYKAMSVYESLGDNYHINYVAEDIAFGLSTKHKTAEAIEVLNYYTLKYPPKSKVSKFRIARAYFQFYTRLRDFENADIYRKKMLEDTAPAALENVNNALGDFYYTFKDYTQAKTYYEKALKNTPYKLSVYKRLATIDSIQGDFQGALKKYQRYHRVDDSIYKNRLEAIDKLKHAYDIKEKDYDIALKDAELRLKKRDIQSLNQNAALLEQKSALLLQDSRLKEARIGAISLKEQKNIAEMKLKDQNIIVLNKQSQLQSQTLSMQTLIRNVVIIVVLLCLVVIYLLNRQYRLKQHSERLLSNQNTELAQLVKDKSWLLREMHHRVKNNLHTVMALLETQSAYLTDESLEAIKISRYRIYSMSLIHQKLYETEDVKSINMGSYIPELIEYLKESFDVKGNIIFCMEIDPIEFDIKKAVPLGLIINETITNSLKYAFIGREKGKMQIRLKQYENGHFTLTMQDNGVGLPIGLDVRKSTSLGIKLIKGLGKQIDAKVLIESNEGTLVSISYLSATLTKQPSLKILEHPVPNLEERPVI